MLPKTVHPTHTVEMPSDGLKIKIRPMKMREEKVLLMAKQSKDLTNIYETICRVLNACVVEGKFDAFHAPLFDIEWGFIQLRKISVGNMIRQSYVDGEDNVSYTFDINLDDIKVIRPEQVRNPIAVDEKTSVMMRYPTGGIYKLIGSKLLEDDVEKMRLINKCIATILSDGKTYVTDVVPEKELEAFVDDLPIPVFEQMQTFIANMPTLSYVIEYQNSKGTQRKIELSSLDDFFTFV